MDQLFDVVSETPELLVINKPAGLVCHPTKGDALSSLIGRIRIHVGSSIAPHMINRLDRETSGLVIVAKSPTAALELRRLWELRTVTKEYLAIVHGWLDKKQGVIDLALGKDHSSRVAIKDCVVENGASAETGFSVEREFERLGNRYSLLRVVPRTGRKHQIRIHLAARGHPIVGDKLYGGDEDLFLDFVYKRLTAEQSQRLILPNHALHAQRLTLRWRDADWLFSAEPEGWFHAFCAGHREL